MDKILDKKSFEVGRCGGDEKTEQPRRIDKSRTLKNCHSVYCGALPLPLHL